MKSHRFSLLQTGALASAALLATLSCAAEGPEVGADPIRIGVIVSLTGSLGSVGDHLLQSAQLAEREVLAAGGLLGGRPVEIVFADDRTEPEQAAVVARRMIEDGVVAIIGSLGSSASLAVQEVTGPAQIPQISCCSTSEDLTTAQPTDNRFLFRTVSSDLLQAEVTARYAVDEGCNRLAILHVDDAYGNPFAASIDSRFTALAMEG